MGLKATIQDGQIIVTDGERIVTQEPVPPFVEVMAFLLASTPPGWDYVETAASRTLRTSRVGGSEVDVPCILQETAAQLGSNGRDKYGGLHHDRSLNVERQDYGSWVKGSFGIMVTWRAYHNKTLLEFDEDLQPMRRRWDGSVQCEAVKLQIRRLATRLPITNVVALGMGSLHQGIELGIARSAGEQLFAVLTIRELLSENGQSPTCTLQEPTYSTLEKEYLRSLGLEVVDDPDAFSCIDDGTLVINVNTYFGMRWWIADGVRPAAMIDNNWSRSRPFATAGYPKSYADDVERMLEEYDVEPFVAFASHSPRPETSIVLRSRKLP